MFRKAIHYFLYPVRALDDLPAPVGDALRRHLAEADIRSIIVIPPQDYAIHREARWKKNLPFGWRMTPQRTLAFGSRQIVLVEADNNGAINTRVIPLDCLVYVRLGTILLYAYLELAWLDGQHIEKRLIEYNAVGEQLIRQQVNRARQTISNRLPPAPLPPLASTAHLPFKFNNYLKYSLLPGEPVLAAVHQPAIKRGDGWLQPYLSPNRTIAVTDRFLLLLEEPERRRKTTYGIITGFVPLDRVRQVAFRQSDDLSWIRLDLGGEAVESVEIPLETPNADVLRAVWDALHVMRV
ncbi:MAG: hypothetical protein HZC41_09435 [Chloroflexi bacterium]|nr:hypothetical protein [Chloroflexota bacterium]